MPWSDSASCSSRACVVDGRDADQARQRALLDAQHLGLLGGEAAARGGARSSHLVLVGLAVLLDGDLGVADAGQRAAAVAAEDVGDAPDGKGDDQQAKQDLGQDS